MDVDACDVTHVDEEKAREIRSLIKPEMAIQHLGAFFKVMGDVTRLKIILSLSREELCVCDLAAIINVSPSAVSHQLRILRGAKLVKYRREGKTVYYSLDDKHVENLLENAQDHLKEQV
jgi:DNA-binding transcriptional ArsR family regulator